MIDVLKRIKQLQKQFGLSTYKLAEQSDLTQSTLANMFSRGTMPSLSTLDAICKGFGISMSVFFNEDTSNMTIEEKILLDNFRKLSPNNQKAIYTLLTNLNETNIE